MWRAFLGFSTSSKEVLKLFSGLIYDYFRVNSVWKASLGAHHSEKSEKRHKWRGGGGLSPDSGLQSSPGQGGQASIPSQLSVPPVSASGTRTLSREGDIPGRPLLVAIGRGKWNNSSRVAAAPPPVPGLSKGLYLERLSAAGTKPLQG